MSKEQEIVIRLERNQFGTWDGTLTVDGMIQRSIRGYNKAKKLAKALMMSISVTECPIRPYPAKLDDEA